MNQNLWHARKKFSPLFGVAGVNLETFEGIAIMKIKLQGAFNALVVAHTHAQTRTHTHTPTHTHAHTHSRTHTHTHAHTHSRTHTHTHTHTHI